MPTRPAFPVNVRMLIAITLWFTAAVPAAAQVNYAVTFNDPNNLFTTSERANMVAAVQAAGSDWGRYFQTATPVTLSVQITLNDTFPLMTGRSGSTAYVNTVNNTYVFEQSAGRKLRTGSTTFAPPFDIELTMNQNYLRNNLYFEPNLTSRSGAIPNNRTDAYSVFTHEIGHAIYMNGWRNPNGTLTTPGSPNYQSTWDQFVTPEVNGDALFRGPNAMAVYGAPVPVTTRDLNGLGNPNHYGNLTGAGSDLVPGQTTTGLVSGLMNGVVFHYQNRYAISALDLAIAKDAGMTLAPFRWSGGSGNWQETSRWNFDPAAGPNAVIPNGTPFDARLDAVTGSPYTVMLNQQTALNSFTLASADATLLHTGGTFAVGSGTLTSGTYRLDGGQLNGGVWTSGGGSLKATSHTANVISAASLGVGVLDLSPVNSYVRFTDNATFATPAAGTTVGSGSVLALQQASLDRGTITLNGGSIAIEGTRFVALGSDVTVRVSAASGTGSVGMYSAMSGVGELGNGGILEATGANATLTINPTGNFTNAGVIRTTNPTAQIQIQPGGTFTNLGLVNAKGTVSGGVINGTGGQFFLNGTVSGALEMGNDSTIGMGPSGPGTLTVGSATFRNGGTYRWQIKDGSAGATAGVGFDRLNSAGALDLTNLTGPNQFRIQIVGLDAENAPGSVSGFDPTVARSWVIGHFANDLSGTIPNRFQLDASLFAESNFMNGGSFSLDLTQSGDMVLSFTPVPEPAVVFGLAAVSLGVFARLRRRVVAAT